MAGTKISALTAASAPADANEIAINEAGTTKKLTVALLIDDNSLDASFAKLGIGVASGSMQGVGVHIYTGASAATVNALADEFIIESNNHSGMSFLNPNDKTVYIYFGDPESANAGSIIYAHSTNEFTLKSASHIRTNINGTIRIYTDATGTMFGGTASGAANELDVNGACVIGSAYAGVEAAPTDGLFVEGNVGIGDTTGTYPLIIRQDGAGEQQQLALRNYTAAAAGLGSKLSFQGVGGVTQAIIAANWEGAANTDAYLKFLTRGSSSGTEKMRITGAGNVGIGVTAFGTNAVSVLGITADGVVPSSSPAGMIQIFADDSSGGAANATLGIRTEEAVVSEASTPDTTIKIWWNGVEYKLPLEAV